MQGFHQSWYIKHYHHFQIDARTAGEYLCTIRWGTIIIESTAATLTVRAISVPPRITNVAKGGEAKLTCKTTGDAAATITFHKSDGDAEVGTVIPSEDTDNGVVTTTGILTISNVEESDSFEYYCKASWGTAGKVLSNSVYLSVLGVTQITSVAWGVVTKIARFECRSDAILKRNDAGEPLNMEGQPERQISAAAEITWEYYDGESSTWMASTEDNR